MTQLDLPLVTSLRETRQRARAPHTCSVCGLPIAIGTSYSKTILIDNDSLKHRFKVIKWHLPMCPAGGEAASTTTQHGEDHVND